MKVAYNFVKDKIYRKKCVLVMGGSGQLGKATVNSFVTGWPRRKWKVFNIDTKPNPQAHFNFVIDPTEPMLPKTVESLHTELEKCDEEFDMMINLAGHYYPPNTQKVLKSLDTDIHPH